MMLHYDGTSWSTVSIGTVPILWSIWGSSASNVWAVGDNGAILHYNGTSWSSASSPTLQLLNSVWGTSSSDVWAVGGYTVGADMSGTILHGSPGG
jgi:hypothetical protein